jgi:hypothetical protein
MTSVKSPLSRSLEIDTQYLSISSPCLRHPVGVASPLENRSVSSFNLDYLEYARLEVMPDRTVALISHENTPMPGTDICVAPGQLDIVKILMNTIDRLQLSDRDLSWVHPDYEPEFKRSLKSNQNLVA